MAMTTRGMALVGALSMGLFANAGAFSQEVTGTLGSPSATTTIDGKQLPPPDPAFGGVIKEKAIGIDALVAAADRPAEEGAEHPPDHDGRPGLRRARHIRRGHPHAVDGSARCAGAALHELPFDRDLLVDPRGDHHRPQSPLGRLRRRRRGGNRLSRLRFDHPEGQGHDRHDPQGERLRDVVVRQGPQHAVLRGDPGRPLRPLADRLRLRLFLRLRRRRHQPVAAEPLPQHDGDLSLRGQSRLEPRNGHGRRRDPVHEADEGDRARQAVLRLLRPRRHPCAAPSDAGMDRQDRGHASLRRRLEQAPRDDLRQPEAARHHARERRADALAEGNPGMG